MNDERTRQKHRSSFILPRSSFLPKFIEVVVRIIGELIERPLQPPAPLLNIAVVRHRDRLAVDENRACERKRDDGLIPRSQQLFFFAATTTGTTGRPVACAA